jgi:CheY-like chemotaxis protein
MNEIAPTVFLIDDDQAVRDAVGLLLRATGLIVESFASATDFLKSDGIRRPGCLLLDVRMPGMSGLDLQKQLQEQGHHIPIIFMTGHGDIPMATRAMKAGAFDFIEKPFQGQTACWRESGKRWNAMPASLPPSPTQRGGEAAGAAIAARAGGPGTGGGRSVQQGDRRRTRHQPVHGGNPPQAGHGETGGGLTLQPDSNPGAIERRRIIVSSTPEPAIVRPDSGIGHDHDHDHDH